MHSSLPSLAQRIVAIPVALFVPPLAVFMARGVDRHFHVCLAVFVLAVVTFFALYAGVGLLLYLAAIAYGLIIAVWMALKGSR